MDARYQRRKFVNGLSTALSGLAVTIGVAGLVWILATLFIKGLPAMNWAFFTESTPAPGSELMEGV
jgi:phosphate transport system permease protein